MHRITTRTWIASAMAALGTAAAMPTMAAEFGTVLSSTPAYAQVSVPQRQCFDQEQTVRPAQTGAGGLLGALVGGLAGHAVGHGGGRALATGAGVIGGALLGNHVEENVAQPTTTLTQRCQTVHHDENRLVGYDVVYSYNGQHYSTRLDRDPGGPGAALPLNVNVSPAAMAPPVQAAPVAGYAAPQVVYSAPPVMVHQPPVVVPSPVVYAPPVAYAPPVVFAPPVVYQPTVVAPPFGLSIDAGWGGGHHHWR